MYRVAAPLLRGRAALLGAGGAAAGCASASLAEPAPTSSAAAGAELQRRIAASRGSGVSLKEVRLGGGAVAVEGTWATVHYVVRLVGDGTVIDETRTSGSGDRDYGRPFEFAVGDVADAAVLRAFHACVLDMRVGGVRRVRTSVMDPSFGYLKPPRVLEARHGQMWERELRGDWLIDVEVSLEALAHERPAGLASRVARQLWDLLPSRGS